MKKRNFAGQDHGVTIVTVSFRSSVQIKPFQHVHVEATAHVLSGQTPHGVLSALKTFVARELQIAKVGEVTPEPTGRFQV